MTTYAFKTANMKKEQSFTLYPYDGGDYVYLQSDKRFMKANLRTGVSVINATNRNYANSIHLQMEPLTCQLPEDIKIAIQGYLWNNKGNEGNIKGVMFFDNKELFSNQ